MIAEIIINTIAKQLNRTYDYIIPDSILKKIKIGSRVFVPFGKTKQEEGFVIGIKEFSEFANKEIIRVEDNILNENNIELAKLMSKRYFCNISDCIRLMLPPGNTTKNLDNRIKEKTGKFVYLKKDVEEIEFDIDNNKIKSEKQKRVLKFLLDNDGIHVLDLEVLADTNRNIIKTLEKNEYIEIVEEKIERNPFINKNITQDKPLSLNQEQLMAYEKVSKSANSYKEFLIYGVTGSRKNRNIFAINKKCNKPRKNCDCTSSRNITYTSNGR